ncbi:MAG: hypothetical protein MJE77_14105, partial [Proteobacteria bacterium]|nr:hypothetical protein [Pseudomonadota bacterium]
FFGLMLPLPYPNHSERSSEGSGDESPAGSRGRAPGGLFGSGSSGLGYTYGESGPQIHFVRFIDTAGDRPQSFLHAIDELEETVGKHELRNIAVLLILDATPCGLEKNLQRLNRERIQLTYGVKKVSSLVSSVVVFLNKTDALDGQGARHAEEKIKNKIGELFRDVSEGESLKYCKGSALHGDGVHDALALLGSSLGVPGVFYSAPKTEPY